MAPKDNIPKDSGSKNPVEKPQTNNGKRRALIFLVVAALLIVGVIYGLPYIRHALTHESTDDAFIDGTIVSISPRVSGTVNQVLVQDNQWVHAGQTLVVLDPCDFKARRDAARAVLAAARATVQTRTIGVDLTRISTTADLNEAHAALKAATALVNTAQAQAAAAASLRDQAQAQLAVAQAALAQTQAESTSSIAKHQRDAQDLKRAQDMAKKGAITAQALDHAQATERMSASDQQADQRKIDTQKARVQQARAALAAAQDNLHQAQAQIKARQAQEEQARARLAAAQSGPQQINQSHWQAKVSQADLDRATAELQQASLQLSYTTIAAPVDGYVTRKNVEPGDFVQTGQALMAVVRSDVWVTANFKETQLTHMRPGQPVAIRVDAFPDVIFTGRVDSIQHGTGAQFSLLPPENATGNFIKVVQRVPVKIVFDQTDPLKRYPLVLGLSVQPDVDITAAGTSASSHPDDETSSVSPADPNGAGTTS